MPEELMHHGILGMKWGVRRTPEQLGHKGSSSTSQRPDNNILKNREKHTKPTSSKRISKLSDKELQELIDRLDMEETYEDLLARQKERNTSKIKKLAIKSFESLSEKGFDYVVNKVLDKLPKDKDPNAELKKEADILKLKNDISKYKSEIRERENPRKPPTLSDYTEADVNKMDFDTLKMLGSAVESANKISKARERQ